MSSFSRCATPIPNSGKASPVNDSRMQTSNRLTVDYIYLLDTNIAPDVQNSNGPSSMSSQQDDSQYASMLAELERSLIEKKMQTTTQSPDDTSITDKFGSSNSSSKDLEFSKELEAALQLIQDLETPSDGPAPTKVNRSDSEKTLSAVMSLPSPEQGPQNGKHEEKSRNIHIDFSYQSPSTSGYSSPISYISNIKMSGLDHHHIFTDDKSNLIRIYVK